MNESIRGGKRPRVYEEHLVGYTSYIHCPRGGGGAVGSIPRPSQVRESRCAEAKAKEMSDL